MKRSNFNYMSAAIIAGSLMMTGCSDSFLEQEPPTKADYEEYFSTQEHIEEALAAVYVPMHMYDYNTSGGYSPLNFSDILGDDFLTGAAGPTDQEQWHRAGNYELTSEMTLHGYWAMSYDGIKSANEAVSYAENNAAKLDAAFCNRVKAEAMVMRNFYYSIVWKWFGNIPHYTKVLNGDEKVAQLSADDAYKAMIADLEAAIALNALPMKQDANNLGRASKAMAYMLYTDLVMYQNDQTRFNTAMKYMTELIQSGEYALNPSFADLWSPDGEWCSESIWEINYTDGNVCERGYDFINGIGGTWLPQVIGPEGGVDTDEDVLGGGWGTFVPRRTAMEHFVTGDARIPVTFLEGTPGNARYQNQNLFLNKYAPRASHIAEGTGGSDHCRYNDNFRVYRYAETLLYAAELIVRGAANPATLNADNLLNQVRTRAGIGFASATLDNIIDERRMELCGEGKRYWDLVRMEGVAGASVKASTVLVPDLEPVNDKGDAGRHGTWTPNKKYIPIKGVELSASEGTLQQNSAYFN